ncbi:MAG: hypothetical protein PVJ39_07730 [Gammaproteobacteria bacterium]|jgi:hypothetical protein
MTGMGIILKRCRLTGLIFLRIIIFKFEAYDENNIDQIPCPRVDEVYRHGELV